MMLTAKESIARDNGFFSDPPFSCFILLLTNNCSHPWVRWTD